MEGMKHEKKAAGGDLARDQDQAEPGPEEALQEEGPAEEVEGEDSGSVEPTAAEAKDKGIDVLEREAEPLQHGEAFDSPFGPLPKRSLGAMVVMVVVAVVVYLIAWALLDTLGLLLGLIPAAALGLLAAREWGRRQSTTA
jgi:hypothetical protein